MLPYQVSYGGTLLGNGTDVQLVAIDGLRSMAPLRTGDQGRSGVDGQFPGLNLLGGRTVTLTFQVTVTSGGFEQALAAVANAFPNIPDPSTVAASSGRYLTNILTAGTLPASMMLIQLPGRTWPLAVFGRPTNHALTVDQSYNYNWADSIAVEFTVDEGAVFDYNVQQASCGLPNPTAGLHFPVTFNASFGSSSGGSASVTNTGNYPTWPVIKITGPCTYPAVQLASTGQFVGYAGNLGSSDTLVIDMYAGSLVLNGAGYRNNLLYPGSSFFSLPPGMQTVGFTTADSTAVAAQMTVACMSAWSTV